MATDPTIHNADTGASERMCRLLGCPNVADAEHGSCENHAWLFQTRTTCGATGCSNVAQSWTPGFCSGSCRFRTEGEQAATTRIVEWIRQSPTTCDCVKDIGDEPCHFADPMTHHELADALEAGVHESSDR